MRLGCSWRCGYWKKERGGISEWTLAAFPARKAASPILHCWFADLGCRQTHENLSSCLFDVIMTSSLPRLTPVQPELS
jgi:hypothetical protein